MGDSPKKDPGAFFGCGVSSSKFAAAERRECVGVVDAVGVVVPLPGGVVDRDVDRDDEES